MKLDTDILFSFLSEEEKNNFYVWVNAWQSPDGENIIAEYRSPFTNKLYLTMSQYKHKEREQKLKRILNVE